MFKNGLQIQRKHLLWLVFGFIALSVLYYLIVVYPRVGKVAVLIQVYPDDASVYIDDSKSHSGTIYLRPGSYSFAAKKDGWYDVNLTQDISEKNNQVGLVPDPKSTENRSLINTPSITAQREALAGVAATAHGEDLRSNNPIIDKLPYSDISGPFKIDFGYNRDNHNELYLIVSYSTPDGRQNALKWLEKNSVDLSKREVIFEDFINPSLTEANHD